MRVPKKMMILSGGRIKYLLRDEFITALAAGSVNGTAAEPGPGSTRVVIDTASHLSIATGEVQFDGGTGDTANLALFESGITRAAGIGLCTRFRVDANATVGPCIGWATAQTGLGIVMGTFIKPGAWNGVAGYWDGGETGGDFSTVEKFDADTTYDACLILRAVGTFYLIKGGTNFTPNWSLVRVGKSRNDATMYPVIADLTRVTQCSYLRVADITQKYPGFATEFGMATAVNETPSTNATLTGKKDSIIEFTWTPGAGETLSLLFRRTDDDNCFRVDCAQAANTIKLYRREEASDTELDAGQTQTWTIGNTYRIEIHTNGSIIRTFVDKLSKHAVVDIFNLTATSAKVSGFATGADFVSWPKGTEGEWASLASFFSDSDLNPPQNVLFVGGSITAGGTSSNPFTTQVHAWMDTTYTAKKYVPTLQTTSGRGSWTQLINMANIVAANPSLIFIDYAVNDTELVTAGNEEAAEAFVRLLRTKLPNAVLTAGIFTWPDNYSHMEAGRRAARDLWKELITRYDLQTGSNLAVDICTAEGHTEANIPDADVEKYFADADVHPNDLGHTTIANGYKASLPDVLPALASQWTPPLPDRYIADSVNYEYDPILRNGTDNDGETGTGWSTVSTTYRQSSTADDTIQWAGTFCSFGLDTNYGAGAGTLAWKVDSGDYANIDLTTYLPNLLVSAFARGAHTVTVKVISGTVQIKKFVAV